MDQKIDGITAEGMKEYFNGVLHGIDCQESTEWETETRNVSTKIRDALVSQYQNTKDRWHESRFIDYCNWAKSLLAVYNFGNLPGVENLKLQGASDKEAYSYIKKDKKYIIEAIKNILGHIKTVGFDITPYLTQDDCKQIFGDDGKITVPITMSVTTVFTTFVYFRRAYSRIGLFSDEDLKLDPNEGSFALIDDEGVTNLSDCVAQAVAQIMYYFADYIEKGDQNRKYSGWGFTLSTQLTKAVTLNDTYAVVDAISRFFDAFNQSGTKRDKYFLDKVDYYGEKIKFESLVTYCEKAMYRTAYNTYVRDEDRLYGKSLFYITNLKKNASVEYDYTPITYEQIASSNRSSALFNPLYVAMITMYGYNEKEIVIRKFMDDYELAKQYYDLYEPHFDKDSNKMTKLPDGITKSISEYSKELDWFDGKNFAEEVKRLIKEHKDKTADDGMGDEWSDYYDIARVFQKYLETQLPSGELMKIAEYRNYLNATKDAIDQIQVAYRKFDDSQRLGIVDTDYIMFSTLDYNADPVTISKLNKANLPANYLRPLLLSSKILIVNALTKYPQSDMETLYEAIKSSRHRKTISRGAKKSASLNRDDDNTEWLWNEDTVDMNSTARHCETIMYDYFDYYEKYELSYKALTNIKRGVNKIFGSDKINKDGTLKLEELFSEDGTLKFDELFAQDGQMSEFKHMVLDLTHQNVDIVHVVFNERLKEYDRKLKAKDDQIAKLKADNEEKISHLKEEFEQKLDKFNISISIGDMVRTWIRDESQRYFKEMLSYMILSNLYGQSGDETFDLDDLMTYGKRDGGLVDGKFAEADKVSRDIISDYKKNAEAAKESHGKKFRDAINIQSLFDGALDDLLRLDEINKIAVNDKMTLNERNVAVRDKYNNKKRERWEGAYNGGANKIDDTDAE